MNEQRKETVFPEGIRAYRPYEKAPDFEKANIVINKQDMLNWLSQQSDEVRLDLKEGKSGKYYLAINDYKKPSDTSQHNSQSGGGVNLADHIGPDDSITLDNIPF